MKTQNNNTIDMQNDSDKIPMGINLDSFENKVANAAYNFYPESGFVKGHELVYSNGAIFGANWQKEKDKAVIDKALGIVKICKFWFGNEANYPEGTNGYNLCKEATELLNEIEKETI